MVYIYGLAVYRLTIVSSHYARVKNLIGISVLKKEVSGRTHCSLGPPSQITIPQ
jgi:hypothetical protein